MAFPKVGGHGVSDGDGMLLEQVGETGSRFGGELEGDMVELAHVRVIVGAGLFVDDRAGKAGAVQEATSDAGGSLLRSMCSTVA